MITKDQLKAIMPYATNLNIVKFHAPLLESMERYEINTPLRIAAFLAQIAHESGSLRYVREIASGEAYEGRLDLGNTEPGDGRKFRGRGLVQLTGRANVTALSKEFGIDFVSTPELLEQPKWAALSAGWFWDKKGLNAFADAEKFESITRRVNGGLNGLQDRLQFYSRAKKILGI